MNPSVSIEVVERKILLIRDQRVMIDSDLAKLYGAVTKRLNEQVKWIETNDTLRLLDPLKVAPRTGAWIETPNWARGGDEPTDGGDVVSNPTAIQLLIDTLLIPLLVRTGKETLAQFTVLGPFPSITAGRIIMGCMLYF